MSKKSSIEIIYPKNKCIHYFQKHNFHLSVNELFL